MKVITLCGSLRPDSTTHFALALAAAGARAAGAEVDALDLRDFDLPFCDGRSDEASYGGDTAAFKARVAAADALLVGSPEYHGSLSGALKNALDLLGPQHLRGKLIGLLATARGPAGAVNTLNHLRHISRWVEAWVLPTQVSIPEAQEAFDDAGVAVREGLDVELRQLGSELVRFGTLLSPS
jgi:NAD(P)H-dependent FMN reductase